MNVSCPHCSQVIEISPEVLPAWQAVPHFPCPACGGAVSTEPLRIPAPSPAPAAAASPQPALPTPAKDMTARAVALKMFQQANRRMLIMGTAGLLALGGLAGYLVFQFSGNRVDLDQKITNQILKNKFFTDLIASGATTMSQLRKVARIDAQGAGYIGLSREEYTWEQALEFARSTGSKLLAVETPSENKAPWLDPTMKRLAGLLEHHFPAAQGSTVWVMQNSEAEQPRVYYSQGVSLVSTGDRPRKVFLEWRPKSQAPSALPVPPPTVRPRNNKPQDIEIVAIRAPVEFTPNQEVRLRAKAGEKFKMELTVWYKTQVPTKLASNLLLKEANILPPEFIADLSANHSTTWHFDTQSRPGYESVNGEGEIIFDLTGYAPKTKGEHKFRMNVGLFHKQTWATEVMKYYNVTLSAE